jgi:hypothetical protein
MIGVSGEGRRRLGNREFHISVINSGLNLKSSFSSDSAKFVRRSKDRRLEGDFRVGSAKRRKIKGHLETDPDVDRRVWRSREDGYASGGFSTE